MITEIAAKRLSEEGAEGGAALTVIVPVLPPSANHAWLPNGRGGKRISPDYEAFRMVVMAEARETARLTGWQVPSGRLQLTMLLTFGTRATRVDIDNRI